MKQKSPNLRIRRKRDINIPLQRGTSLTRTNSQIQFSETEEKQTPDRSQRMERRCEKKKGIGYA